MKNFLKFTSYTLGTAFVFVMSQSSAFAASTSSADSALTGTQVIGGVALLIAAIVIPTMKASNKARINN